MKKEFIYHLIPEDEWTKVSGLKHYEHMSLQEEGFIHFSFAPQIDGVIKRYYQNLNSIFILKVDVSKIQSKLKIEETPEHGSFPHLYGKLNLDAVVGVYKIQIGSDGQYFWNE